jgi:hypothetical protein
MPFQPGQSGNPGGKTKAKAFESMLRIAINEAGKEPGTTRLRDVATALVDEAIEGNVAAINAIADRLDGKVPQAVMGDEDGPPVRTLSEVVHKIVRARAGD